MRKIAVGLASVAAIAGSPALARDGAFYIGGEFGAMRVGDIDIDIGAVENAVTVDHEYGYDGGVFIGYDLGAVRLEAEAAYRRADLDSYATTIRLPLEGAVFAPTREAGGNTSALSFMANALLDFGDDDGISATLGGGVGMARVKANNYRNFSNATPFLDGSDWTPAWQLLAGVRQAISDNVDVTVRYRFFNTRSVELIAFNGAETGMRVRSHSIMGGLTFNLGGSEPAPPPLPPVATPPPYVAPPAPPAPPPPVQCPGGTMVQPGETCPSIGPFIVFFDWDRDEITPQAAGILDNAAEQYRATGNAQVVLAGHADRSGSDQYNVGLSQRRAENVRQYLAGRGVAEGVMRTEAFGESRPAVDTADGVREPQNRRVEITFGPGSGW
ncbi:MAG: OmpA-OmpF porin, family [Sphingomonadales bacterium]|jgi:outer membrane protein OmpA-like peptidoglycan-associated protein|nr:OmpA-OmpF porin, family [Sphingomonadales bacterium]